MKELIYKILERVVFSNGLIKNISGYTLRLPVRFKNYFESNYEADNFSFLAASVEKGDVIIDIGAHIGLFATIAAQVVGKNGQVFAFEPTLSTFKVLQKTIAINQLQSVVTTRPEAIGLQPGVIQFYISDNDGDNSNSIVKYKTDRPIKPVDIPMLNVDTFITNQQLTKVDFIKFDVEGAEFDAIRGAKNTLEKFKPVCILAIHPESIISKGDTLEALYDYLATLPYEVLYNGQALSKSFFITNMALIDLHLKPLPTP